MDRRSRYMVFTFWFLVGLMAAGVSWAVPSDGDRFFYKGDGRLALVNIHNGSRADVTIRNTDGSMNGEALAAIDRVFGFSAEENGEHISLRLINMLDYFSDKAAPGKVIHLNSGHRSPEYNEKLKKAGGNVASTSTHLDGMALDFFIEGVPGKRLWEMIRKEDCCGVGHYGGASIHLDAGKPRFWEAATSKVRTGESDYNRRIYLSTEYDRYSAGEKVRLSLSSISQFGFGIKGQLTILKQDGAEGAGIPADIHNDGQCIAVTDRKAARFIYTTLPADLRPGKYRIRMQFCDVPFPQMPLETLSNVIEVVPE